MASIRPSSQASQRRLPTLTSPGQHQQPSTDSPLFPARKTENRRNRPRQVESPKLCLGPDMTLAGWIQVSASTTAYTVRTGPDTGITNDRAHHAEELPRPDQAFQCVRPLDGRQRGGGALRSGAKRLTRAKDMEAPGFITTTAAAVKIPLSLHLHSQRSVRTDRDEMRINRQEQDEFPHKLPHTHTSAASSINSSSSSSIFHGEGKKS